MSSISPDLRKEHERAHGRFLAPHALETWGWGTPAGKERARRRSQLLIHYARIEAGMRVLEFGCGTGLFSRQIAEIGAYLISLDISPELIEEARKTVCANIEFKVGDIELLDFPDTSFNAVIGSSILHHVQAETALKEAFRVLKVGGRVAFAEPNMLNPQILLQKNIPYLKRKMGDSPDETAFVRWRAARMLKNAGFADVIVRPFDFLHPSIPAKVIPAVKRLGQLLESLPFMREIAGSIIMSGTKRL